MFWTRRTGHLSDEDLSAYLDGELGGARLEQARGHLATCPDCSASLETLREVQALVSRLPAVEPPRSFVLTPSMAGTGQRRPQPAPRRQSFVFVPAVALTLLVALIGADLVTSGSGSTRNDAAGTASQAMIAKDASSSGVAESAAGGSAADAPQQRAFGAQVSPQVPASSAPPSVPAPNPTTGEAVPPPSTGSAAATPSGEQQPLMAPVAPSGPVTQSASSASGSVTGDIPAPIPATGATSDAPTASAPPPDASGTGSLSSEAVPAPAPETANANDSFGDDDGASARNSAESGGGGTDWLRVAEALAAAAFVASLAYVFGPGLIKKGH